MSETKNSNQKYATLLRIIYPIWIVFGIIGLVIIPGQLIDFSNATATATTIEANELLFRIGIICNLMVHISYIFTAIFLFKLFEDVNKDFAGLMAIFALVGASIGMLNELNSFAALLSTSNPNEMMFYLKLHELGILIASIFWGLWLLPLGLVIYQSGYFPQFIGYAVFVGGIGYFIGTITEMIFPDLTFLITIFELLTLGEILFILWLVVRGVSFPET